MAAGTEREGPRLEFVLRPLPGTVVRTEARVNKEAREIEYTEAVTPAGFMLYLADGHSYRLTQKQVVARGLDREPGILNFEKANDPKTAAGRFKLAVSDTARKKAYAEMEQEVINVCERFAGDTRNYVYRYDPKGKVSDNVSSAA